MGSSSRLAVIGLRVSIPAALSLAVLLGAASAQEAVPVDDTAATTQPATDESIPAVADEPATPVAPVPQGGGSSFPVVLGTLPSGKTLTIRFRATVNNPFTGDAQDVSNQATVTGGNFAPVVSNDPDTAAPNDPTLTPIDLKPDLSLAKGDGGASVVPGGSVGYTLAYQNLSAFGAHGVTLTETVPALTTFNAGASSAGWSCVPNNNAGSVCTLSVGLVSGGTSGSRIFAVTLVNPVPAGASQISNTASIASNRPDPVPANNTASDTTPIDAAPDLTLAKSDGGASTTPGGTVAYTLSYANAGNQGATGVVLTETVPANTTFNAGASTAGWACAPNNNAGSTCTLAIGALAGGGANGTATYAVSVVSPVPAGVTQISNTASVADDGANGADPVPANNTASDTTPVNAAPDLSVTKSDGGASVSPGGTVAYTLSYQNAGNQGATGVVLTETVPANATFNAGASTAGWVCTPNNNAGSSCTLAIGALAAGGGSATATYAVTVVNPVPAGVAQISNTVSIADDGANGADPTPGNNTASDTTPVNAAPDLTIVKDDAGASVVPGGTVTYTLSYQNVGNQGATGVVLTDVVPANTTFNAGASTAGWVCTPNTNAGSSCTLAVGALAGGSGSGSASYAVTVVDPVPGGVTQVSNTASVADDGTNGADPTPANNSDGETTPIVAAPDLAVTKSDGGASVAPGGTVAYALDFSNIGNRGATGVVLLETVPASTTFNPGASSAGWTCTPNNNAGSACLLALGSVAVGATGSRTFAVTVVAPAPAGLGQVSNTVQIDDDHDNGLDPNFANNTATDTTPVDAAPELSITKSDGGASAAPGGTVAYTLGYQNAGNQGATGVFLFEIVPQGTTFLPGSSTPGWLCNPNPNAGSTCTLPIGPLASGASSSATFVVALSNPVGAGLDQVSNTATVGDDGANGGDPNPANNDATDTTPVVATPDLAITKSDGGATAPLGGTITYTLTYSNVGNQGASGVVLTETVPANTTFDAANSAPAWTCVPDAGAGSTCTFPVTGPLDGGGASFSVAFAVTVDATVPPGVLEISNTATIADDGANGTDPNPADNTASDQTPLVLSPDVTTTELTHGFVLDESLAALAGPAADADLYRLSIKPYSSYEVVVDGTAGGVNQISLDHLDADGTTVLQSSTAVGTGTSRRLAIRGGPTQVDDEFIRVMSGGCTTSCGADTRYRIRAYETTYTLERFNNIGGLQTVLILQNRANQTQSGTIYFWDANGVQVGFSNYSIAAHGLVVLPTATVAPNASGSMTVITDGPYGMLAGKAAVLDPINGPAQDVILKGRVR